MFVQTSQILRPSQRQDENEERWIETDDSGQEHLTVHCGDCHQRWRRNRIVRIEKQDFAALKLLEQGSRSRLRRTLRMVLLGCLIVALLWFTLVSFDYAAVTSGLILTMIALVIVRYFVFEPAWRAAWRAQGEILERYPVLKDSPDVSIGVTTTPGAIIILPKQ